MKKSVFVTLIIIMVIFLMPTLAFSKNLTLPNKSYLVAKFEWDGFTYVSEEIRDGFSITVSGNEESGYWTSNLQICLVIIKGGRGIHEYWIYGGTSGGFNKNDLPLTGGGQYPDISNISFYRLF